MDARTVVVRHAGEGPAVWSMGQLQQQKLVGEESGGDLTVLEILQPPGLATPLHVHPGESEAFYILEGRMTYQAGEEMHDLVPGSFVYLPQGVPHAFRTREQMRLLALAVPSGVELLYEQVGRPAESLTLPPPPTQEEIQAWVAAALARGMEVVGAPIPE
ncbi:MAG: cupin domain-containing protein [Actinomycetota bacterium]